MTEMEKLQAENRLLKAQFRDKEVEMLLLLGYNEYDLDDMLYDAEFRRDCKAEIAEYMYVGGN